MNKDTLSRLQKLNQLQLTEAEEQSVLGFFEKRDAELAQLEKIDTADVERMVHVMPVMTVVREDVVVKNFSRDDLQSGAPETDEGYWCVPKVME